MFDRLLQVHLDRPHGDPEAPGDFSMWQALDPRQDQHASPALGQFSDRAPEQVDFGAILRHARGVGPVVGNVEQAVDLVDGETAAFGPTAVAGDIERDTKQVGLRTPYRSDVRHAFEPEICLLKHVGGKICGTEPTRKLPIKAAVIRKQQIT